jgi:hypothetical protein
MKRNAMRRLGLGLFLSLLMVGLNTMPAWGVNSLVVHSDSTGKNAALTIYLKITNDVELAVVVVPVSLRTINGSAFVSALAMSRNPVDRLTTATDGDGNALGSLTGIKTTNRFIAEDGNCKNAQPGGFKTISTTGPWTSPAAALFVCGQFDPGDPNDLTLQPGTDSTVGSLRLTVTTSDADGRFEVDTTCTDPANHLVYVPPAGGEAPNLAFTKGIITVGTPLGVYDLDAGTGGLPKDYDLGQNYPNPCNAGTVINFTTKVAGHVQLDVFNILGQKVTTLVDQNMDYGQHAADWNGADASGRPVPTGLYFYRLSTKDFSAVKKMVLIK